MTAERFSIADRLTSVLPRLYEKVRDSAPRSRKGRVRRSGRLIHATASGAPSRTLPFWSTGTGRRVRPRCRYPYDVAVMTPIGDCSGFSSRPR